MLSDAIHAALRQTTKREHYWRTSRCVNISDLFCDCAKERRTNQRFFALLRMTIGI
jgi:hypothetical protein